jgi:hypothetical protein
LNDGLESDAARCLGSVFLYKICIYQKKVLPLQA